MEIRKIIEKIKKKLLFLKKMKLTGKLKGKKDTNKMRNEGDITSDTTEI